MGVRVGLKVEFVQPIGYGLWGLGWGLSRACTVNREWAVGVKVGLKWSLYSQ